MIIIAADHAGADVAVDLASWLEVEGVEVANVGAVNSLERIDYPDIADALVTELEEGDLGVLICGTGIGMSIRANRYAHIRAAVVWDEETAQLAKEHNHANVICLGARKMDIEKMKRCVRTFLDSDELGGRHAQRCEKLAEVV